MRRALASVLVLLFISSALMAYQLSPLNVTYAPTGADSAKVYTITNDSDSPIAIEVTAEQRIIDLDGNEVNQDGSAYFSIQPSRMIIPADTTQLVRVQYRGPSTVTRELSFRIVAEQIPYSQGRIASSGSMFNFLYVFRASAYVLPSRVQENVQVSSVVDNGDGTLAVTLTNNGNVHQILYDCEIRIRDGEGGEVTLSGSDALPGISGSNILAGMSWTKDVPMPEGLASGSTYSASIDYDFDIGA